MTWSSVVAVSVFQGWSFWALVYPTVRYLLAHHTIQVLEHLSSETQYDHMINFMGQESFL